VLPRLWLELSFSVAGAVSKAISNHFQRGLEFCMDASCAGGCYPLCLEEQAGNSYIGIHHQFSCFIFIDAQYEVQYMHVPATFLSLIPGRTALIFVVS